jgi:hypothetical protein
MCYSLIEILVKVLKWEVVGMEDMTGLPEYRNGIQSKDTNNVICKHHFNRRALIGPWSAIYQVARTASYIQHTLHSSHPSSYCRVAGYDCHIIVCHLSSSDEGLIYEHRDRIAESIRQVLGVSAEQLSLAQVLESATWKGGREIARQKRAQGGPPIEIESDGTVF